MAYSFTSIIYPNDTATEARGVNDIDQVVGFHGLTTNLGFAFAAPSIFFPITPPGATQTQVYGINNTAGVVGSYVDANKVTHGFAYNTVLRTYATQDEPGTGFNKVLGINDRGEEVGYSSLNPTGQTLQLAYARQFTGSYIQIDDAAHNLFLPANVDSQATGIDNLGDVVGFYMPTATTSVGYLIQNSAALGQRPVAVPLQFPGSTFTQALGINNVGQITGFYNDAAGTSHGFIWDAGNWTTVDVPGARDTTITGINDTGRIVGFDAVGTQINAFEGTPSAPQVLDSSIGITSDKLNLTTQTPNASFSGGTSTALSGQTVVNASSGLSFITNGSGADADVVDVRAATADIWSTISNFHTGDTATVLGVTAQDFTSWLNGQGTPGFTGLTTHLALDSGKTASLTLAGYTTADLGNGRLTAAFGTESDGTPFLNVHAN